MRKFNADAGKLIEFRKLSRYRVHTEGKTNPESHWKSGKSQKVIVSHSAPGAPAKVKKVMKSHCKVTKSQSRVTSILGEVSPSEYGHLSVQLHLPTSQNMKIFPALLLACTNTYQRN